MSFRDFCKLALRECLLQVFFAVFAFRSVMRQGLVNVRHGVLDIRIRGGNFAVKVLNVDRAIHRYDDGGIQLVEGEIEQEGEEEFAILHRKQIRQICLQYRQASSEQR